jgi:hypothetical protein
MLGARRGGGGAGLCCGEVDWIVVLVCCETVACFADEQIGSVGGSRQATTRAGVASVGNEVVVEACTQAVAASVVTHLDCAKVKLADRRGLSVGDLMDFERSLDRTRAARVCEEGTQPLGLAGWSEDREGRTADSGVEQRVIGDREVAKMVRVRVTNPYRIQVFQTAVLKQSTERASAGVDPKSGLVSRKKERRARIVRSRVRAGCPEHGHLHLVPFNRCR